jgi:hypothetical protein
MVSEKLGFTKTEFDQLLAVNTQKYNAAGQAGQP